MNINPHSRNVHPKREVTQGAPALIVTAPSAGVQWPMRISFFPVQGGVLTTQIHLGLWSPATSCGDRLTTKHNKEGGASERDGVNTFTSEPLHIPA